MLIDELQRLWITLACCNTTWMLSQARVPFHGTLVLQKPFLSNAVRFLCGLLCLGTFVLKFRKISRSAPEEVGDSAILLSFPGKSNLALDDLGLVLKVWGDLGVDVEVGRKSSFDLPRSSRPSFPMETVLKIGPKHLL